ncbi:hypothetical protein GIB67_043182 [Kingdonia uniflora]|uniref:Uncharacterized protein n=1 Tax=Kingdonia uniflora TaxID=39325 RepID=A0A7J7NJ96_9MAGN|nr:hypothetical protein GIB67_043182 [Kingdonia uniflora]
MSLLLLAIVILGCMMLILFQTGCYPQSKPCYLFKDSPGIPLVMLLMEVSVWFLMISFIFIGAVTNIAFSDSEQVPVHAMFVFGDSLTDPGNNNDLITGAKTNYPPHGIDFPKGTTGRACNGATMADHLGYLLGLGLIPAFSKTSMEGSNFSRGVNFASEAAGILNDTGFAFGDRFPMDRQIANLREKIIPELQKHIGRDITIEGFLAKSLFYSNIGTNDYQISYLNQPSYEPILYPVSTAYGDHLIEVYIAQLKELYNLGARKFLISALAPFGCIPYNISIYGRKNNKCVDKFNKLAREFNSKLKTTVQQLNKNLAGAYFLYWDLYNGMMEILDHSSRYGFKNTNTACCGAGHLNSRILCLQNVPFVCANRSEYFFWDSFHPSDATNAIVAKEAYEGILQDIYPMNVKQLLQL